MNKYNIGDKVLCNKPNQEEGLPSFKDKEEYEIIGKIINTYKGRTTYLGYYLNNKDRAIYLSEDTLDKWFIKLAPETDEEKEEGKKEEIVNDEVNHPRHYEWLKEVCGIEPIDITRHMDFNLGNAIKYILRAGRKPIKTEGKSDYLAGMLQDLKKAAWYINDEIKRVESKVTD